MMPEPIKNISFFGPVLDLKAWIKPKGKTDKVKINRLRGEPVGEKVLPVIKAGREVDSKSPRTDKIPQKLTSEVAKKKNWRIFWIVLVELTRVERRIKKTKLVIYSRERLIQASGLGERRVLVTAAAVKRDRGKRRGDRVRRRVFWEIL